MENAIKEHSLRLENNTLYVSGVESIICFEVNEVILQLKEGTLTIVGDTLELIDLSIKTGNIIAKGNVKEMAYGKSREKVSILKKLFK